MQCEQRLRLCDSQDGRQKVMREPAFLPAGVMCGRSFIRVTGSSGRAVLAVRRHISFHREGHRDRNLRPRPRYFAPTFQPARCELVRGFPQSLDL